MAYCTLDDLLEEIDSSILVELTDDLVTPTGEIDTDAVASAIERAASIIDGYVGARYTVPLDTVTETITTLSEDIAIYTLFSRRISVPKQWHDRFELAMSFLKAVADGNADLGSTVDGEKPTAMKNAVYAPTRYWPDDVWETY